MKGSTKSSEIGIHLGFLDGIRGWAALNVALVHAWGVTYRRVAAGPPPGWFMRIREFLVPGEWSVCIFIVLSGFCLALPIARGPRLELPNGLADYVRRRALRILPPYYAALFLSLAMIALYPAMTEGNTTPGHILVPAFGVGPLLSHLLVVHNFSATWMTKILSPAWSIAIEWQIYFLLPLVFLPIWKRLGPAGVVVAGLIIGALAPSQLAKFAGIHNDIGWRYVALFSFGIAAAGICFPRTGGSRLVSLPCWRLAAWGLSACCALSQLTPMRGETSQDFLVGVSGAVVIVYLTFNRIERLGSLLGGFLNAKTSRALGQFSYSLYLTHSIVYFAVEPLLFNLGLPLLPRLILMFAVALPAGLGLAYLFHLVVERPSLRRMGRRTVLSPGRKDYVAAS